MFMYVMHTKKAQVPNEAARVRQQQHRQQQQQELQSIQRQAQVSGCVGVSGWVGGCVRACVCGVHVLFQYAALKAGSEPRDEAVCI